MAIHGRPPGAAIGSRWTARRPPMARGRSVDAISLRGRWKSLLSRHRWMHGLRRRADPASRSPRGQRLRSHAEGRAARPTDPKVFTAIHFHFVGLRPSALKPAAVEASDRAVARQVVLRLRDAREDRCPHALVRGRRRGDGTDLMLATAGSDPVGRRRHHLRHRRASSSSRRAPATERRRPRLAFSPVGDLVLPHRVDDGAGRAIGPASGSVVQVSDARCSSTCRSVSTTKPRLMPSPALPASPSHRRTNSAYQAGLRTGSDARRSSCEAGRRPGQMIALLAAGGAQLIARSAGLPVASAWPA